uniref:LAGLIDADG endonuclease n=1 Tax=Parasitella parasitica TaxID=35722 RepID=A0A088S8E1_9FUNG|nr:LAGLIDADG endonuclease [Parasitella parasitica]AIO05728.1 LAGLIDADG endonuclease [Parasitella parasitica]
MYINNKTLVRLPYLTLKKMYRTKGTKNAGNIKNTDLYKNTQELTNLQQDILIGLLLGDATLRPKGVKGGSALQINHSQGQKDYILYLHNLFEPFIIAPVKFQTKYNKVVDMTYYNCSMHTLAFTCFANFRDYFYLNNRKIVPVNIGDLLKSPGLAHWAMDDGSKADSGFILHTESFTFEEVMLLIKVLKDNFELEATPKKARNNFVIYIKASSIAQFKSLVKPYFVPSMLYKLK